MRRTAHLYGDGFYDGSNHPVEIVNHLVVDDMRIVGIKDIRTEALRLSLLSESLPVEYSEDRLKVHADFEPYLTRLGLAMGREADRRSRINEKLVNALNKKILGIKEEHEKHIRPQMIAIERLSKNLKSYSDSIVERSKIKPLNSAEDKAYDRIIRKSRIYNLRYNMLKAQQNILIAEQEALYRWLDIEKQKMAAAYKSVIADIRPVGGSFSMTKFSDEDCLAVMNKTVGKDYPTAWIEQSNAFSPLVVKSQKKGAAAGSYYAANHLFTHENSPMLGMSDRTELGDPESIEMLYQVLKHSDPSMTLDTIPFECEDDVHQVILHYDKEFFDPAVHDVNSDGTPAGEGWLFNDFPWHEVDDDEYPFEDILPLNQWYRKMVIQGENFDSISVEDLQVDHTYHEFAHRAEHVVKNGAINFQEQAFLERRSFNMQGDRLPLIMITDDDKVMKPFFNVDTTFSELNSSVLNDIDERGTDDVFQYPVMQAGEFINPYIGRVYCSAGGREVVSMGAEIAFAGTYGAFKGYDPDFSVVDLDHRGFTLGVFAVM